MFGLVSFSIRSLFLNHLTEKKHLTHFIILIWMQELPQMPGDAIFNALGSKYNQIYG